MADPNVDDVATSDREHMRGISQRARAGTRERRAVRALAVGFALIAGAGCIGPGLEPPFEDRGSSSPNHAVMGGNPPAGGQPSGSGSFGNPGAMTPATGNPGQNPGGTVNPPAMVPISPGASAGSGASAPPAMMEPAPAAGAGGMAGMGGQTMSPSGSNADGGMAGSNPNAFGLDFVPTCSDETAQALMADGVCSYPLPAGTAIAPDATRIALVSDGAFSLVERVDGPFDCSLISGGFYVDMADPPTRITLCAQSCLRAGAAAEMQVVLVQGCPPTAP